MRGSETLDKPWGQLSVNLKDVSVFHEAAGWFPQRSFLWLYRESASDGNTTSFLPYSTFKVYPPGVVIIPAFYRKTSL